MTEKIKQYTVKLIDNGDDGFQLQKINEGFGFFELMAVLEHAKHDMIHKSETGKNPDETETVDVIENKSYVIKMIDDGENISMQRHNTGFNFMELIAIIEISKMGLIKKYSEERLNVKDIKRKVTIEFDKNQNNE